MKGFTLIEVIVVVLIFSVITIAIFGVMSMGRRSWHIGSAQVEVQQETRLAMDRIMKELRQSGTTVITDVPADGSSYDTITFQITEDTDGDGDSIDGSGNVEWGDQITYSLDGEQLLRTSAGSTTIMANKVSSVGFRRQLATPNTVEISLQTQKGTIQGGNMQSDLYSQVHLRN